MGERGNKEQIYLVEQAERALKERVLAQAKALARLEADGLLKKLFPNTEAVLRISQYLGEKSNSNAARLLEQLPLIGDDLSHAIALPESDEQVLDKRVTTSLGLLKDNWAPAAAKKLLWRAGENGLRERRVIAQLRLVEKPRRGRGDVFVEDVLRDMAKEEALNDPEGDFALQRVALQTVRRPQLETLRKQYPDPQQFIEDLLTSDLRPKK